MLTLPSENYLAEQLAVVDPQRIHSVREALRMELALALQADWVWAWEHHHAQGAYRPDATSSGRRALAGLALSMLCLAARSTGDSVEHGKAYQQVKAASNMTERFNALSALVSSGHPWQNRPWRAFYELFQDDAAGAGQMVCPCKRAALKPRWQRAGRGQATAQAPTVLTEKPQPRAQRDLQLLQRQPRRLSPQRRGGLCFWADRVLELDALNPQVGARLARALNCWRQLAEPYHQRSTRGHRPRGRQARPFQRCARGASPAPWRTTPRPPPLV